MQVKAGTSYKTIEDGSVAALDAANVSLVDALAVVIEQIDAVRTVAMLHGRSDVDARIVTVLEEVASVTTFAEMAVAQGHVRALLRGIKAGT